MQVPKIGEHYRHYKSKGGTDHTYEIVGLAKHTEIDALGQEAIFVVYKPLYNTEILTMNKLDFFVRPLSLFIGSVEVEGTIVARFTKL